MMRTTRRTQSKKALLCCAAGLLVAAMSAARAMAPAATPAAPPASMSATSPVTAPATQPETQRTPAGPAVTKLTVRPSAATRPAMRYKLLPDLTEQAPGNAVSLYLLARSQWPDLNARREYGGTGGIDYLEKPVEQLTRDYIDRVLAGYEKTLQYVDAGARRREAHWGEAWRELGYWDRSFTYLNDLRNVINILAFRSRVAISRRDWDRAAHSMQTAFALARHLGAEPTLVHSLTAEGFAMITLYRSAEEWIARGDSPNLYWPLTDLPQPFVELRAVKQWDKEELRYWNPWLGEAVRGELPRERWPEVLREVVGRHWERRPPFKRDPAEVEAEARRLTDSALPRARQFLLADGVSRAALDAMTPEQAVGTYLLREYQAASDDLWKSWTLPYWQAEEQMMRSWRDLAPDRPPAADNPLIQSLLVGSIPPGEERPDYRVPGRLWGRYRLAKLDQYIALLRTVEALRDYAARHGGLPPERLDQITDLPIPADPGTGGPFGCRREGRTAILEAAGPQVPITNSSGVRYELTFAP